MRANMGWSAAGAWARLREEMNILAWLMAERWEIQRLQFETLLWTLGGVDCGVGKVEAGAAAEGTADDPEQPAQGTLD